MAQVVLLFKNCLYCLDSFFYVWSVVDMDVSENIVFGFDTACKVFFVLRLLFLRF